MNDFELAVKYLLNICAPIVKNGGRISSRFQPGRRLGWLPPASRKVLVNCQTSELAPVGIRAAIFMAQLDAFLAGLQQNGLTEGSRLILEQQRDAAEYSVTSKVYVTWRSTATGEDCSRFVTLSCVLFNDCT